MFVSELMWQKLHFLYFTRRSIRKSSRYFPTTSVHGTNGSRRAGSKEPGVVSPWLRLFFSSSSSDSPCMMSLEFGSWLRHLPTLRARPTCTSRKIAEPVSSPDPSQGTMSLGLQFCPSMERDQHVMVVVGISQALRRATREVGQWSGSRVARRQIKDSTWSETGSNSEIQFWDRHFAGKRWWYCRHENGGGRRGQPKYSCPDREQSAGVSFMYACGSCLSENG